MANENDISSVSSNYLKISLNNDPIVGCQSRRLAVLEKDSGRLRQTYVT